MAETARQQPNFDTLMQIPPVPTAKPATAPPPQAPPRVFVTDRPAEGDAQAASPALARIAELVVHRGTEGPFAVALLGGPGSGKSRALAQVLADAAALSKGADGRATPYVPALATVRIDASELGGDPAAAIAEHVHGVLARVAPEIAAQAADEAGHSATDPHARLQSLAESLDLSRRRLDAERRSRDEAESRRARLAETILYDSAGSRVDAYGRANRAAIESALAGLGFTKGEPIATWKDLVRTLLDAGGPTSRVLSSVRSLWAYPGQTKRLVWAVIFFGLAWGFGALASDQGWIASIDAQGETMHSAAGWLHAHLGWLAVARHAALAAALLCLLSCAWRAFRFSRLLLRGAALVDADLDVRRGELDNLVAHHAQRVEALAGETDVLARRVMEAEKRAGAGGARATTPAFLSGAETAGRARAAYLAHVDAALARGPKGAGRVVVAIDDLETLPPAAAIAALESAANILRFPRFGLVAAFDADRLVAAQPDFAARLGRLVQVPFRVDGAEATGWREVVSRLTAPRGPVAPRALDPARSTLDAPLGEAEQQMLATLAPLAGPSPRGVKRLVNLYRLGRPEAQDGLAAFAFALALAIGGTAGEKARFEAMLRGDGARALGQDDAGQDDAGELRPALDALAALMGGAITVDQARRARALAAQWSLVG